MLLLLLPMLQVWDVTQQQAPLLSFDVGAAVGDVAWAPHSSTVFAAVTDEGKVHVFDLAQNRQLALCAQKVSRDALKGKYCSIRCRHACPW
jgi:dynein intermediate chain 1